MSNEIKNGVAFIHSKDKFIHIVVNNKSFNVDASHVLYNKICSQAQLAMRTGRLADRQHLLDLLTPGKHLEVASNGFVEYDQATRRVFIKGTDSVLPVELGKRMTDLLANNEPIDHLVKFWKRCQENPDPVARNDIFWFLEKEGHPITEDGLFVAYKKVETAENAQLVETEETTFNSVIHTTDLRSYVHQTVKRFKAVNKNTNNYTVFLDSAGEFQTINVATTIVDSSYKKVGKLADLANRVDQTEFDDYVKSVAGLAKDLSNKVYTDSHSRSMRIEIGTPIVLERSKCDSNPHVTCSRGLHVGAMEYVRNFFGSHILLCLVNPRDVVAIPKDYNGMKMRVCEYLPIVEVTGTIDDSVYKTKELVSQAGNLFFSEFEEEDDYDEYDESDY